jgi:indolepyruvate ferredoxin oxidoreductase alpha subunit
MKHLLTGNEAIARGAYEAGLKVGSAYPGTPSTEIFENLAQYKDSLYCEWAPNEKVATEVAYGASIAGVRSLCAMKHVGLNVAADPVFTATYQGVGRGFVIVTADDPDMHSSQNEQDNRYYAKFAKMPMLEPSDSQECLDFMKVAYEVSEKFDIPVLFRVTTRVCHSKSLVEFGERQEAMPLEYKRNARKYVCAPANAKLNHPILEKKLEALEAYANSSSLNVIDMKGSKIGVVAASIAYQYAKEVFPEDASFLKLGFTFPLPMGLIRDFAAKVEKLYVVEELEPFMEEQMKAAGIDCVGKAVIPRMYELNPEIVARGVFGVEPTTTKVDAQVVSRPPALCPGCPHRGFFYTMAKGRDYVITGDIGCYTLGSAPPLGAMDSVICMGGGFSVGMGMAKAFEVTGQTGKKVFGVVGDSTFFHSGMTGAVEITYNKGKMIPCVLDNSITGMTGHQDNPGSGATLSGEVADSIKIENVLEACGYEKVIIVDPQDLAAMDKAVKDALASEVPAAIISRRPCLLIKRIKHDIGLCAVDREKCKGCKSCLKVGCPAVCMKEGKAFIDETLCVGCAVCAQVCPFGAIEKVAKK